MASQVTRVAVRGAAVAALALIGLSVRSQWSSDQAPVLDPGRPTTTATTAPSPGSASSTLPPTTTRTSISLLAAGGATGRGTVGPFTTAGQWQVQFAFDCGNLGHPGRFAVSDGARPLVDVTARNASKVMASLADGSHTLEVTTACGWVLSVYGSAG